ncbi:hypothetical protein SDC9_211137 [bioreactor metagenome]|uniref:Uncharacterized protein n=1 Tax=bioreactor metagenome TaxID=1076179 RepID=A0A645JKY1_9ZZZZ
MATGVATMGNRKAVLITPRAFLTFESINARETPRKISAMEETIKYLNVKVMAFRDLLSCKTET